MITSLKKPFSLSSASCLAGGSHCSTDPFDARMTEGKFIRGKFDFRNDMRREDRLDLVLDEGEFDG